MKKFLNLCAALSVLTVAACASPSEDVQYEQTEAYQKHLSGPTEAYRISRKLDNGYDGRMPSYEAKEEMPAEPAAPVREDNVVPVTGSADAIFDDRLHK